MCGIVGANSTKLLDYNDVSLLYLQAEDRGGDACGFTNGVVTIKKTEKAPEFLRKFELPPETKRFIGHTRYKTFGENKLDNAHPFEFSKIIGVHNGSIFNWEELKREYNQNFSVDSEMLYWMINELGLETALGKLRGCLALAYYNREENDTLYLYRYGRPLAVGYKDGGLYFASLTSYLEAIGCSDCFDLDEHTLYRVVEDNIVETRKLDAACKPTLQTTRVVQTTSYNTNTYRNNTPTTTYTTRKRKNVIPSQIKCPWYATCIPDTRTGILFFWWFDEKKENVINIFEEDMHYVDYFDMTATGFEKELFKQYPAVFDDVLDSMLKLHLSRERKERIESGEVK